MNFDTFKILLSEKTRFEKHPRQKIKTTLARVKKKLFETLDTHNDNK